MVESPFGYFLTDSMDGLQGLMLLDNGKIINKTAYICIGPKQNAQKEVLGIWVGKSESSSFWMSVLPDLKANGVVTCADNLNEFTDTIHAPPPTSHPLKSVWYIRSETPVNISFIGQERVYGEYEDYL